MLHANVRWGNTIVNLSNAASPRLALKGTVTMVSICAIPARQKNYGIGVVVLRVGENHVTDADRANDLAAQDAWLIDFCSYFSKRG